jgi:hypothetical protein
MDRRKLLRDGGIGLAALLAGCGSSSSANDDSAANETTDPGLDAPETTRSGPATFSRATLGGPSNATVGENVTIPVSVANGGGRNGTFTGTLRVVEGRSNTSTSITIEDIGPGEVAETNDSSLRFGAADTYTLALDGTDATHTVTVEPITKRPGSSLALTDRLTVTVKSVQFVPSLFFTSTQGFSSTKRPGLVFASSGNILTFVRMNVENTGTGSATFDPTTIAPVKGSYFDGLPGSQSGGLSAISNVGGSPLSRPVRLSAGEQTSGWLLAQVPRLTATKVFSMAYQVDGQKTPPDVVWQFPPNNGSQRQFPSFSLQSLSMPNQAEVGVDSQYSFTVKNTGNSGGVFRAVSQFRPPDDRNWYGFAKHDARLKPGATNTFKPTIGYEELGGVDYRIRPFGKQTRSVTFVPATRGFGESYTTPGGVEITVSDVQTSGFYLQRGRYEDRVTPDPGQHYLFARIDTKVVEQDADDVTRSDFSIESNGTSYDVDYMSTPLKRPVSGGTFDTSGSAQSATSTGWMVFPVPRTITPDNVTIQWGTNNATARWQSRGNQRTSSATNTSSATTNGSR